MKAADINTLWGAVKEELVLECPPELELTLRAIFVSGIATGVGIALAGARSAEAAVKEWSELGFGRAAPTPVDSADAAVITLSNEDLRREYKRILKKRNVANGGRDAKFTLREVEELGSAEERAIVRTLQARGLPGWAHEDDRFDYLCGSPYCRCSG